MNRYQQSLENLKRSIVFLNYIRKEELRFGDLVLVETKNSTYIFHVMGNSHYLVSGGWFDRSGSSPAKVRINGCTWGGHIIKTDTFAACGMHLEFNNGVITSTIQKVIVFHGNGKN